MPANGAFSIRVKPSDEGKRLDVLVASYLSDCTRTFAAGLINAEHIRVDGQPRKPAYRVKSGQKISGDVPPPVAVEFKPEPIPIDILYEDDHIIVVNKQVFVQVSFCGIGGIPGYAVAAAVVASGKLSAVFSHFK